MSQALSRAYPSRSRERSANPYPVVDGSVYVKIFRQRGSGEKDANGPDVVDQFYAAEGLTVPAGGELPISIQWNIPSYAVSGEYKVATFFTVSRKFNLLGLPFTDDVVGNTASFKVSGELKRGVSFKKDAVTVAGEKYYFAAFPPRTSASDPVTVEATLANATGESFTVPVTWSLYHKKKKKKKKKIKKKKKKKKKWSQNDQANFITSKTEQVTVAAGKSAKVSFVVDDTNHPVYLLQGVAKWHELLLHHQRPLRARGQGPAAHQLPLRHELPAAIGCPCYALLLPPQRRSERFSARRQA